jgi:hypothetical protein
MHRGHVPFSNPPLMPLSFQTPASSKLTHFFCFWSRIQYIFPYPMLYLLAKSFQTLSKINFASLYNYTFL